VGIVDSTSITNRAAECELIKKPMISMTETNHTIGGFHLVVFSGTNVDYQGLIRSTRGLVPLEELAQGLTTLEINLVSYKNNQMRGGVSLWTTIHRHWSCHKIDITIVLYHSIIV
jgi:hypothetical protein